MEGNPARARAYRTDDTVRLVEEWGVRTSDLRPALMWDGGPVGVAETTHTLTPKAGSSREHRRAQLWKE